MIKVSPHAVAGFARVVTAPEDLCVINDPDVSVAIWPRPLPDAVTQALKNIDATRFPENIGAAEQWIDPPRTNHAGDPRLPGALKNDMQDMYSLFTTVAGEGTARLAYYSYRDTAPPGYHDDRNVFQPHADSDVKMRLIVSYTLDPDLVTEWYPVLGNRAEGRIVRDLRDADDVAAAKRIHNVQKDPPGTVMIFRGLEGGGAPLIHNIPVPRRNVFRLVYTVHI